MVLVDSQKHFVIDGFWAWLRFPTTNCIPLIQMLAFDEGDGLRDLYAWGPQWNHVESAVQRG